MIVKPWRLIGCPRRLATRAPTAPGASTMAKVSPVRGWRSCRLDALPGRPMPPASTAADGDRRWRWRSGTHNPSAGYRWPQRWLHLGSPRHVVAGGQTVAEGVFLACAAGIAGLQLAAVVFIVVKAGGQAARLPEPAAKRRRPPPDYCGDGYPGSAGHTDNN